MRSARTVAARGSNQPFYKPNHTCQLFSNWCWCPEGVAPGMDISRVSVQPSLIRQVQGNRDERKADFLEAGWLPMYWKCKFPCLLFLLSMKCQISSLLSCWECAIDSRCIFINLLYRQVFPYTCNITECHSCGIIYLSWARISKWKWNTFHAAYLICISGK